MATTYAKKLRNPLWQKKRLDILNRDEWTCLLCFDKQTELQIHHQEYIKGKEPWEYEDSNFKTYCKHCHCVVEEFKDKKLTPIITAKQFNKSGNYWILSTIFNSPNYGLVLAITYFHEETGELMVVTIIERQDFKGMDTLFTHAEKLLSLNGNL